MPDYLREGVRKQPGRSWEIWNQDQGQRSGHYSSIPSLEILYSMYFVGKEGVEKSKETALKYALELAKNHNISKYQYIAGVLSEDMGESLKWMQIAKDNGSENAKKFLDTLENESKKEVGK